MLLELSNMDVLLFSTQCTCGLCAAGLSVPISINTLPRSRRSGRLLVPTLAWWANQRIFIDPVTEQLAVVQGSEEMTAFSNNMQSYSNNVSTYLRFDHQFVVIVQSSLFNLL